MKRLSHRQNIKKNIGIDRYIKVKKLLFLRSIMVMPEDAICKRILYLRAEEYRNDPIRGARNEYGSPILDIFSVCNEFDMLEMYLRMASNGCHFSKSEWKNMIWKSALRLQDTEHRPANSKVLMYRVIDHPFYLIWWIIIIICIHQ